MKPARKLLRDIGLTDTEVELYLNLLSRRPVGVSELVKDTGIQRTTIYHALETLMQKGFVAKRGSAARLLFSATDPSYLEKYMAQKIALLKDQSDAITSLIPLLQKQGDYESGKAIVSHFEGIEGIKMVVEEALWCKSRRWDIIAPRKNFFSEFDDAYAHYFIQTRMKNNIVARSLWEKDLSSRVLSAEEARRRNPKLLPAAMHGKFKSVVILFDDKVAMISSYKEKNAVLIQSKEFFDTMTALFEGLWISAEQYPLKRS